MTRQIVRSLLALALVASLSGCVVNPGVVSLVRGLTMDNPFNHTYSQPGPIGDGRNIMPDDTASAYRSIADSSSNGASSRSRARPSR